MAEEVGMDQLYQTFYFISSSMHHFDFGGLSAQSEKDSMDADIAPSESWLKEALIIGHGAVLHCLVYYNEVARLEMDNELNAASENFKQAWAGKP